MFKFPDIDIGLPNPLAEDEPVVEEAKPKDPAGDALSPVLTNAIQYCSEHVEHPHIFDVTACELDIDAEREKAEQGECTNALAAASLVIQDIAKLNQAVLSTPAIRKIVAAHYCLLGPSRLRVIRAALHGMDDSTVENAKAFFGVLSKVFKSCGTNCSKPQALYTNAALVMVGCEPWQSWGLVETEAAEVTALLVCHYEAAFGDTDITDVDSHDEDLHRDISIRHKPASASAEVMEQLSSLSNEMEKEVMNSTNLLLIQNKFLFSCVVKAEEAASSGSLSPEILHQAQRAAREAHARATAMELRYNQIKGECMRLQSENDELNANTNGWYAQVEDLKPKLSELEKTCEMEKEAMSAKSAYLQTQLDNVKTKCNGLEERIETLTAGRDRGKKEMMAEDAVLELQNAIQEAEGLYVQIEQLEKQTKAQEVKFQEHTDLISALNTEMARRDVQAMRNQQELDLLQKKEDFATEGYNDAKLEIRNQQHEIATLMQRVHDFQFQILSMDTERAIVLPRLTQEERRGLALMKNENPLTTEKEINQAQDKADFVSKLATLATEQSDRVDAKMEKNNAELAENKDELSKSQSENKTHLETIEQLKIEAGTAKLGRNQFLALSRDLKKQLLEASAENDATVEHYLKEMKFFSDQYSAIKQSETQLHEQADIPAISTKASQLEQSGRGTWEGLSTEIEYFTSICGKK